MREWTIDDFLTECETLCRNPYIYDYGRMPEGICNGHKVQPYEKAWHSIVIDGVVCSMALYNEQWPNGSVIYITEDGQRMTALEYVRHELTK